MTRIAILISGRGSNMRALVETAEKPDFPGSIALVMSNKGDAPGLEFAAEAGILTRVVEHKGRSRADFDEALHRELINHDIDFVCLAGFMRILTERFVRQWEGRMLNIHPSLLPSFRGLHVHEQALEARVAVSGCTVHLVTPKLDGGPIVGQAVVPVLADDTPESLAARVQQAEHKLYPAALRHCLKAPVAAGESSDFLLSLR